MKIICSDDLIGMETMTPDKPILKRLNDTIDLDSEDAKKMRNYLFFTMVIDEVLNVADSKNPELFIAVIKNLIATGTGEPDWFLVFSMDYERVGKKESVNAVMSFY